MDDQHPPKWSVVQWKRDRATTVLPTTVVRTDENGKVEAKWKNRWLEVQIIDQSDDEELLLKRRYDADGNLMQKEKGSRKQSCCNEEILARPWIGAKTKIVDATKGIGESKTDVKKSSLRRGMVQNTDVDTELPSTSSGRGRESSATKLSHKDYPAAFSNPNLKNTQKTGKNSKQSQKSKLNQMIDVSSDEEAETNTISAQVHDEEKSKTSKVKQNSEPPTKKDDTRSEKNELKQTELSEATDELTRNDDVAQVELFTEVQNLISQRKLAAHPEIDKMELCKGKGVYISVLDFAAIKSKFMYKAGDLACAIMEWVMDKDLLGRTATGWMGTEKIPKNVLDSVHFAVQDIMRKATHNAKFTYNLTTYRKSMTNLCNRKNNKAGIKPRKAIIATPIASDDDHAVNKELPYKEIQKPPKPVDDGSSEQSENEIEQVPPSKHDDHYADSDQSSEAEFQYRSRNRQMQRVGSVKRIRAVQLPGSKREKDLWEEKNELTDTENVPEEQGKSRESKWDFIERNEKVTGQRRPWEPRTTPSVEDSDEWSADEQSDVNKKFLRLKKNRPRGSNLEPEEKAKVDEYQNWPRFQKESNGDLQNNQNKKSDEKTSKMPGNCQKSSAWNRAQREEQYGQSTESRTLNKRSWNQTGSSQWQKGIRGEQKRGTTTRDEDLRNLKYKIDAKSPEEYCKKREYESSNESEENDTDVYERYGNQSHQESSEPRKKPKIQERLPISPGSSNKCFREPSSSQELWEESSGPQNIEQSIKPAEKRRKMKERINEYPRWSTELKMDYETPQKSRKKFNEKTRNELINIRESWKLSGDQNEEFWHQKGAFQEQSRKSREQERETAKRDENWWKESRKLYEYKTKVSLKNEEPRESDRDHRETPRYLYEPRGNLWEQSRESCELANQAHHRELQESQRNSWEQNYMSRKRSPERQKRHMQNREPSMQSREPPTRSQELPIQSREPFMRSRQPLTRIYEPQRRSRAPPMQSRDLFMRSRESPMERPVAPMQSRKSYVRSMELQRSPGESREYGERSKDPRVRSSNMRDRCEYFRDQPKRFYDLNREMHKMNKDERDWRRGSRY